MTYPSRTRCNKCGSTLEPEKTGDDNVKIKCPACETRELNDKLEKANKEAKERASVVTAEIDKEIRNQINAVMEKMIANDNERIGKALAQNISYRLFMGEHYVLEYNHDGSINFKQIKPYPGVRDDDMLVDIFNRNKRFTDHAVANSPREGQFKRGLKTGYRQALDILIETGFMDSIPPGFGKQEILDRLQQMNNEIENEDPFTHEEITTLNIIAMYREIGEYVDCHSLKWWGRGVDELDREHAIEEMIDLLHFVMIGFDLLDCTPEEIYHEYVNKNDENWERFKKKKGWGQNNETESG